MASAGGVFSETLRSITTTKLTELSKKRTIFEEQNKVLVAAAQLETDQKERLRKLVDGVKRCFSIRTNAAGRIISNNTTDNSALVIKLRNIEGFLEQARYDPSVSSKLLQDMERSLMQQLNMQSLKYEYATLYGHLVTEWLSEEQVVAPAPAEVEMSDRFEEITKENIERDESRAAWENLVFQPFETDKKVITTYLHSLFGKNGTNIQAIKALITLRKSVETFEFSLANANQFNVHSLQWAIKGLLSSDLLSDEKRGVLKDFLGNTVILAEVADVLNMRMAALNTWDWDSAVSIEQRIHVNGNYHIHMHEDLLQAIFLQFIGVKWSVFFKSAFKAFADFEGAWATPEKTIPKLDMKRREYFLGSAEMNKRPSVQSKRQGIYRSIYFMSQLLDSEYQDTSGLDGQEEAVYEAAPSAKRKRTAPTSRTLQTPGVSFGGTAPRIQLASFNKEEDGEDEDTKPQSRMEKKQYLLHLLSTEILVNTHLHGEITCTRSEFDQWGPSLPHSTIYAVLSFYGVSEKWRHFFRRFLEAPLKFMQDGSSGKVQNRKRGMPQSHVLSEVFGEVILFALDYSVNQATDGAQLHRIHDDFWIWSSNHQTVMSAWKATMNFSEVMGLSLNEDKSGTVRILRNKEVAGPIDPSLPTGEIRWGFLILQPQSGRFIIDQSMVEKHIEEFQKQLQDKKTIFSWIQAWNAYANTFFKSNFGTPANCFGRIHIDMILTTLERIQRRIFTDGSSVVDHLKKSIQERFSVSDIPDGYLYFTTELGGLELVNPFVELLQIREAVTINPASVLSDEYDLDMQEQYRRAKITFENGNVDRWNDEIEDFVPEEPDTFFSFEEFSRYSEEFASSCTDIGEGLYGYYLKLLKRPEEQSVEASPSDLFEIGKLRVGGEINGSWNAMRPYWRWIVQLYGADIIERFGGLDIIDPGLLPMGMVSLFRSGRVKWQG